MNNKIKLLTEKASKEAINEEKALFSFKHDNIFSLPQTVYGVKVTTKTKEAPLEEALELDLLRFEVNLKKASKKGQTSKGIKEAIKYTSFDNKINSYLEAILEEATLEALKDNIETLF